MRQIVRHNAQNTHRIISEVQENHAYKKQIVSIKTFNFTKRKTTFIIRLSFNYNPLNTGETQ